MYARSPDVVRALISGGAHVDAADSDGVTSLIRAAHFGQATVVKTLLDCGAAANLQTKSGKTAIDFARARIADYASMNAGLNSDAMKKRMDTIEEICSLLASASFGPNE
jgi:hypothetical protein